MTRGNTGIDRAGNLKHKAINLGSDKSIFENQIVPVWTSTKVAATILGITPNALRIRKCRGEIECRYFGKHLRFNVSELESHIREERQLTKGVIHGN